jgi:CubicO group peptidase (beta-lactamase class C family)
LCIYQATTIESKLRTTSIFKNLLLGKTLLGLFLLAVASCTATRPVEQAVYGELGQSGGLTGAQIDSIAEVVSSFPSETQFSIAIINDGRLVFYGLERREGKLQRVFNSNSVFEIGSLSKVFTTQLLLHAVQKSKIDLDQKVSEASLLVFKGNPEFTFRQLANHTSGLPSIPSNMGTTIFNADNPYAKYSEAKLKTYLSEKLELNGAPGERYEYSNLGMGLLRYTLVEVEDTDYKTMLQQQIFEPLKMINSTADRAEVKQNLVQGYNRNGKPTPYWDMGALEGAAGIYSTTADLAKYAIWSFDALNDELSLMKQKSFSVTPNTDIALGWHIIKNKTEKPFLWHNGGSGGFKTSMAIDPDKKQAVIVLTNVGATFNNRKQLIDNLCFELMRSIE